MTGETAQILTLAAYYAVLALLALYGAHRGLMLFLYYRHRGDVPRPAGDLSPLPRVTVQLPIFNEVYVVERLIEAAAALDYPRDLLEIQVLDDSTDETSEAAREAVSRIHSRGIAASHRRRRHRDGFKAGALRDGLEAASGQFVLVLDADFVAPPDLLRRCLPFFSDPEVGMVQARWGHLNREFSRLTRIQAILLDGHFVIEHTARHRSGRFFNFNGTAGVWRRRCVEDAGGWESDTLTEDLDISYRAQLRGWKFVYLEDCVVPAEVPVDMDGLKSQQHRWTKGSIQTGRKLLPRILRSGLPGKVKAEAFFHLTGNAASLLVVILALLMVPAIVIRDRIGWQRLIGIDFPLFFGATLSFLAFYVCSQRRIGRSFGSTVRCLPGLLSLGIGLSVNNARAVLEGLGTPRRPAEFFRTPKYRIEGGTDEWRARRYRAPRSLSVAGEAALAAYFLAAIGVAVRFGYWTSLPFLVVFFSGFGYTALLSAAAWRPRGAPDEAARVELG